MVGFKKDNDKSSIKKSVTKYLLAFIAGFIIAVFLVLYIVMSIVNRINSSSSGSSSEPETSSEVSSSSEPSSSESSVSSEDPYIEDKGIYANLLDVCKEYDPSIYEIINLNYDETYMYVTCKSDDEYIHILSGEYTSSVETTLEGLITTTTGFTIDSEIDNASIETVSDIDITTLDVFKNDTRYQGYTYKAKINYYGDLSHEKVVLTTIGYKENNYISINRLIYDIPSSSLDETSMYLNNVTDVSNTYYSFISYLYSRG